MQELEEIIKQEGKWIKIVLGKSIITDPEEQSTKTTLINPILIKGLVTELTANQLRWKMFGIENQQGMEIIVDKKYKNVIQMSQKIIIDNIEFVGYLGDIGKLQVKEEGNYLKIYTFRRN